MLPPMDYQVLCNLTRLTWFKNMIDDTECDILNKNMSDDYGCLGDVKQCVLLDIS